MKSVKTVAASLVAGLIIASCGDGKKKEVTEENEVVTATDTVAEASAEADATIVGVAMGNPDFSTLVTAVKAADLVETLSGAGPFTVFAPTNAAFAKLPAGTVDTLLKPESLDKLKGLLTYHVVAGKFDAAAVTDAITKAKGKFIVKTVQGENLVLSLKDGKVIVTDAKGGTATVVTADVAASNGIIHAIDSVIMPK